MSVYVEALYFCCYILNIENESNTAWQIKCFWTINLFAAIG